MVTLEEYLQTSIKRGKFLKFEILFFFSGGGGRGVEGDGVEGFSKFVLTITDVVGFGTKKHGRDLLRRPGIVTLGSSVGRDLPL